MTILPTERPIAGLAAYLHGPTLTREECARLADRLIARKVSLPDALLLYAGTLHGRHVDGIPELALAGYLRETSAELALWVYEQAQTHADALAVVPDAPRARRMASLRALRRWVLKHFPGIVYDSTVALQCHVPLLPSDHNLDHVPLDSVWSEIPGIVPLVTCRFERERVSGGWLVRQLIEAGELIPPEMRLREAFKRTAYREG